MAPSAFGVVSSRTSSRSLTLSGPCKPGCTGPCCSQTHGAGCPCSACSTPTNCNCGNCRGSFALCSSATPEAETVPETVPEVVASIDDAGAGGADAAHSVTRDKGDDAAKAKKGKKVDKKPISELAVGQEIAGKVKTVASYGAFVDLGYASDGLVHISRIADDFVSNVEDHLKAGQEVNVRVISVDLEKKQVALTMRSEEVEANAESDSATRKEKRKQKPRRSGGDRAAQAASATALARSSWDTDRFIEGEVASVLDFGGEMRRHEERTTTARSEVTRMWSESDEDMTLERRGYDA
ncbi:hypothetical protein TL16_g04225 [Triparma laevis f. inornata]|uniref:S1 motif domain-containing protein n=1 Tax=Triparma laevis f. inornata TaxID=1714386 RepID=A0A9W7E476_9STRA|nr:hypothetical protein TL16_g04225 [Triparma laevis f. inornata]